MKTASKSKKRAVATPVAPGNRATARRVDVLLAARLAAAQDDDASIHALASVLPLAGVAAALWRPYEDRLADACCLHLFGAAAEFLPLVKAARKMNVKVVLSPELWHDHSPEPSGRAWLRRSAAWFQKTARGLLTRTPAWQRELFSAVDLLVPNSHVEAQKIARRTRVPLDRMRVVPLGVDPRIAEADPRAFRRRVDEQHFVLYFGAIEPKNQQLGFLWAMKNSEVPLVILGDAAPGCKWYLEECRRVGGAKTQFVSRKSLGAGPEDRTALLASAWTACSCLVVGSGESAGERVALKAGASGTPLVLFDGGCGSEYFGQQAFYVRPDDTTDIRRGVLAALDRGRSKSLAEHVCTYFSWSAVARAMRAAYGQARRQTP